MTEGVLSQDPMNAQVSWKDYLVLCKPKVVALMMLTAIVGMCLASPGWVPWRAWIMGSLGIGMSACSAAALNHLADRHIDRLMQRTQNRPMAQGRVSMSATLIFSSVLCVMGMGLLILLV